MRICNTCSRTVHFSWMVPTRKKLITSMVHMRSAHHMDGFLLGWFIWGQLIIWMAPCMGGSLEVSSSYGWLLAWVVHVRSAHHMDGSLHGWFIRGQLIIWMAPCMGGSNADNSAHGRFIYGQRRFKNKIWLKQCIKTFLCCRTLSKPHQIFEMLFCRNPTGATASYMAQGRKRVQRHGNGNV